MSNRKEDASADSERYELNFCIVDHNFMRTTGFLLVDIWEGMRVKEFIEAVSVENPGLFNKSLVRIYYVPGEISPKASAKVDSEGCVEVLRRQTFTRNAMALQAAPQRWAKIPDDTEEDLYYVIQNPAPPPVEVIGSDDQFIEWTAHKQRPLLFKKKKAPSLIGKASPADLHKDELYRYINYNCPRETDSISLTLLAEVFGQFKDDCDREPDSEMSQEMHTFAEAAFGMAVDLSEPRDEKALMKNFNSRVNELYGIKLEHDMHPNETDGHLVKDGRLRLLNEFKGRNPSGDALVQAAAYYRCFYADHLDESSHLPEGEVLPAFLITCQGPLVNVYGIACVELGQVQTEYLTSVNAGCHWTNKEEIYKLSRILYALRMAFHRLDRLPELSERPTSRPLKQQKMSGSVQTVWPYPHTFTKLGSNVNVEFQYLKQLDGDRYLFEVRPVDDEPSSKNLLVKFTQSYGRAVHEELARAKYAPELVGFSDLSGGWKMVVMEFLKSPVWKDGDSLPNNNEMVQRGLSIVRDNILPLLRKKGYVHGDIRLSNLLFRVDGAGDDNLDPPVKLVDFDLAGKAGKTTYPFNLNIAVRPPGHRPCAPLEFSHDDGSLKALEDEFQGTLKNGDGCRHK